MTGCDAGRGARFPANVRASAGVLRPGAMNSSRCADHPSGVEGLPREAAQCMAKRIMVATFEPPTSGAAMLEIPITVTLP